MEFRWLTGEEKQLRAVESGSLSEVLALAQRLQAESEGLVSEEQLVEMGRELGVQPEYVREALRLRRAAQAPRPLPAEAPLEASPARMIAHASLLGLGLGTLPLALAALARYDAVPLGLLVLIATLAAGGSARRDRWAGIAGTWSAAAVVLISTLFITSVSNAGFGPDAFFLSLLSFCPLGSAAGRLGARARRWAERLARQHPPLGVSGR